MILLIYFCNGVGNGQRNPREKEIQYNFILTVHIKPDVHYYSCREMPRNLAD